MTIFQNSPGQVLTDIVATDEVTATTLPVASGPGTYRTMLRVITPPLVAGDLLDVDGRARVTSSLSYAVGVGYHLWQYDVDNGLGSSGTWTQISSDNGDNVFQPRHHMPLHTSCVYQVPADWPAGHRMTVVLRADAMSTAWQSGDAITVDQAYGQLTARRWSTP